MFLCLYIKVKVLLFQVLFIAVNSVYYKSILKTEKLKSALLFLFVFLYSSYLLSMLMVIFHLKKWVWINIHKDSIISAGSNALKIVLDEKNTQKSLLRFYFRWKNLFSRTNGQLEITIGRCC